MYNLKNNQRLKSLERHLNDTLKVKKNKQKKPNKQKKKNEAFEALRDKERIYPG